MKIGYLGPNGSFHSKAVAPLLAAWYAEGEPRSTPADLVAAVARGDLDFGLLAVETNLNGLIGPHLRSIFGSDVEISGEVVYEAVMAFAVRPGVCLDQVTAVYSHPEALAECDQWLSSHVPQASRVPANSTASGVEMVTATVHGFGAAIAHRSAAEAAGLDVLADGIADPPGDITRFWLLGRDRERLQQPDRCTVLIEPESRDLAGIQAALVRSGLSLSRFDCITTRAHLGEYRVLVEASATDFRDVRRLQDELAGAARSVRLLGWYPSARLANMSDL